jgi:hypothetical protein
VDGNSYDYSGGGLGVNQNVYDGANIGIDVGVEYSWLNGNDYDANYYVASATVFKKGVVSPFFTATVEYDDASEGSYDWDEHDAGGAIGIEVHLLPGWYVTPKVSYMINMESGSDDQYTTVSLASGYWFCDSLAVMGDVNYSAFDGSHGLWFDLGVAYHY